MKTNTMRRSDVLLARVRAHSLDTQLAAGAPPSSSRLLAARAALLTSPESRSALADWWEDVRNSALATPAARGGRVRVARQRVRAATPAISRLVTALRAPAPMTAKGVAQANELLRQGGGPIYNARSGRDLEAEVRQLLAA